MRKTGRDRIKKKFGFANVHYESGSTFYSKSQSPAPCSSILRAEMRKQRLPPESQIRMTGQDPLSWLQPDQWGTCQQLSSLSPLPLSRLPAERTPRKHTDPSSASPRPATKDRFQMRRIPASSNLRQSPQLAPAALPPLPTHLSAKRDSALLLPGAGSATLQPILRPGHTSSLSIPGSGCLMPTPRWPGTLQASAGLRRWAPRPHFRRSLALALAGQRLESSHHRSEPTRVPDPGSHAPQPRGTQSPGPLPRKHPPGDLLLKPTNTTHLCSQSGSP